MINFHTDIVAALNTILPTHYEMTLHSGLATPCISYMESNNFTDSSGDTLGYSVITYQIKVWANDIATIQKHALLIDEKLRSLGFKRTSSGELYDNQSTMIQKIMLYEVLVKENYN